MITKRDLHVLWGNDLRGTTGVVPSERIRTMRAWLTTTVGALLGVLLLLPGPLLATKPSPPLDLELLVAGKAATEVVTDVGAVVDLTAVARPRADGASLEIRFELPDGVGHRRGTLRGTTAAVRGREARLEAGVALDGGRRCRVTVVAELVYPDGSRTGTARSVEVAPPGLRKAQGEAGRVVHPRGGGALIEHQGVER